MSVVFSEGVRLAGSVDKGQDRARCLRNIFKGIGGAHHFVFYLPDQTDAHDAFLREADLPYPLPEEDGQDTRLTPDWLKGEGSLIRQMASHDMGRTVVYYASNNPVEFI